MGWEKMAFLGQTLMGTWEMWSRGDLGSVVIRNPETLEEIELPECVLKRLARSYLEEVLERVSDDIAEDCPESDE